MDLTSTVFLCLNSKAVVFSYLLLTVSLFVTKSESAYLQEAESNPEARFDVTQQPGGGASVHGERSDSPSTNGATGSSTMSSCWSTLFEWCKEKFSDLKEWVLKNVLDWSLQKIVECIAWAFQDGNEEKGCDEASGGNGASSISTSLNWWSAVGEWCKEKLSAFWKLSYCKVLRHVWEWIQRKILDFIEWVFKDWGTSEINEPSAYTNDSSSGPSQGTVPFEWNLSQNGVDTDSNGETTVGGVVIDGGSGSGSVESNGNCRAPTIVKICSSGGECCANGFGGTRVVIS